MKFYLKYVIYCYAFIGLSYTLRRVIKNVRVNGTNASTVN